MSPINELKISLKFSADKGSNYAVMTSQEAVRGVLLELDAIRERVALFDWLKTNVGNIDFDVIVPPDANVMSTNPWIAVGGNFESAIRQAKEQLAKAIK